ncbi:unnamed protein product [Adineta steineri]|uniref:Carrier domain-containing protein n=1 Tax=Adineta steineri TaxID=433720 RepID=A0A819B7C3_9BILA|nr:unnamed protein product [Adineta steineri]CAF3796275.1 unnamed protein product [Adineta steineri]
MKCANIVLLHKQLSSTSSVIYSKAQAFHAQTSIALGLLPLTPLEEHLRCIFSEAFDNESPNVNMSFEQMGGTSINVLWACSLIRRQIGIKIEPTLIFANPSVRQLACAVKPCRLMEVVEYVISEDDGVSGHVIRVETDNCCS